MYGSHSQMRKIIVQCIIIFTHLCKWENETCSNSSRNEGGEIKENDGGGEVNYDTL
jgi:hypothetical protein